MMKNDHKVKESGLKPIEKELREAAQAASGELEMDQLFSPDFMSGNTEYATFSDFLSAGGYENRTREEFDALPPDDEFEKHIQVHTDFDSWEEMQHSATALFNRKKGIL